MTYLIFAAFCTTCLIPVIALLLMYSVHDFTDGVVLLLSGIVTISYIVIISLGFSITAASVKKDLINEYHGTSYTTSQIFFASDVIEELRESKRTRIDMSNRITKEEYK